MRKPFLALVVVVSMLAYTGCAQHDTSHPDSGGAIPVDQRNSDPSANGTGRGVGSNTNNTNNTNMNNDHSNNNGAVNTADSSINKNQKQ